MQKKGFVELKFIPGTRNRKKIILTEEGKEFANAVVSKIDEIENNAFLLFTEDERELFLSLGATHQ